MAQTPASTRTDGPPEPAPASFEAALQELEGLIGRLESGQLPLEELIGGYQRGSALLDFCRDRLARVEQQIQVLDGDTARPWTPD